MTTEDRHHLEFLIKERRHKGLKLLALVFLFSGTLFLRWDLSIGNEHALLLSLLSIVVDFTCAGILIWLLLSLVGYIKGCFKIRSLQRKLASSFSSFLG